MAAIGQQHHRELVLAPMTSADLPAAVVLSRDVGWPHRLEDWQFVLSVGEGLAGHVGGALAATAMWWPYEQRLTRIGMVIVDPRMQRSGLGRALMTAVLGQIDTPMMLNATEAGAPLYRDLGFEDAGLIHQHQGTASSVPPVEIRSGERIRPAGRRDLEALIELDADASGVRREKVIAGLIEHAEVVVLDAEGRTAGFAFFRRFGRGHVVGPVVAADPLAARALIAHWVGSKAGMFMRIDVPESTDLTGWLDAVGLVQTSVARTLARGSSPYPKGKSRLFALANQALG